MEYLFRAFAASGLLQPFRAWIFNWVKKKSKKSEDYIYICAILRQWKKRENRRGFVSACAGKTSSQICLRCEPPWE